MRKKSNSNIRIGSEIRGLKTLLESMIKIGNWLRLSNYRIMLHCQNIIENN
jgi:hypothetical protein